MFSCKSRLVLKSGLVVAAEDGTYLLSIIQKIIKIQAMGQVIYPVKQILGI